MLRLADEIHRHGHKKAAIIADRRLLKIQGYCRIYRYLSVTAPSLAVETSFAYFASTPRV